MTILDAPSMFYTHSTLFAQEREAASFKESPLTFEKYLHSLVPKTLSKNELSRRHLTAQSSIDIVTSGARNAFRHHQICHWTFGRSSVRVHDAIMTLLAVASVTGQYLDQGKLDDGTLQELTRVAKECAESLKRLDDLREYFLGWLKRDSWSMQNEVKPVAKGIEDSTLALERTNIKIRKQIDQLETRLNKYIRQVEVGQRETSVPNAISSSALSVDGRTLWHQIQEELRGVGLTTEQFNAYKDKIVVTLTRAFNDYRGENIVRYSEKKPSDLPSLLSSLNFRKLKEGNGEKGEREAQQDLIAAIESRDVQGVENALQNGALVDGRDPDGFTPLWRAVNISSMQIAKFLLTHNADVNKTSGPHGRPPLICAITNEDSVMINLLLDHGASLEQPNKDVLAPLHVAVSCLNMEVINPILQNGPNLQGRSLGETPLCVAINEQSVEVAEALILHGADVNQPARPAPDPTTPLSLAVTKGSLPLVKLLLTHGANSNQPSRTSSLPLFLAVKHLRQDIITILLQHGAYPGTKADGDDTSFLYCVRHKYLGLVKSILKECKSPVHIQGNNRKALLLAVRLQSEELVELLLTYGFGQAIDGPTLFAAVGEGNLFIVKALFDHQIRVPPFALLSHALEIGSAEICSYLLEKGPEMQQGQKNTLLIRATIMGEDSIVLKLIQEGANVNAPATTRGEEGSTKVVKDGETPLWIAAAKGYQKIVEMLLEHGAKDDYRIRPKDCVHHKAKDCCFSSGKISGCTAVQIAVAHGHRECVQSLVDHGANINGWVHRDGETFHARLLHLAFLEPAACLERTFQILLDTGADLEVRDHWGKHALHFLAEYSRAVPSRTDPSIRIGTKLFQSGTGANVLTKGHVTPLMIASSCKTPDESFIRLLHEFGAANIDFL